MNKNNILELLDVIKETNNINVLQNFGTKPILAKCDSLLQIKLLIEILSDIHPIGVSWMSRGDYLFRFYNNSDMLVEIEFLYPDYIRWEDNPNWNSDMKLQDSKIMLEWLANFLIPPPPSYHIK